MKKSNRCPQCGSEKIKIFKDEGLEFVECIKCGYDELDEDDSFPETRTNQKEKGSYSPYKTGGKDRSRKK